MHVRELFTEHQHLLRCQRLQPDHRGKQVPRTGSGELSFRQAGPQRFIAVDAAPPIFDRLGCRPHDDSEIPRFPLQGVVVHRQHLLIVILPCDGIRDLVEVDQLVDHDHHSFISRKTEEHCKQLQILIPVVVRDKDADTELVPGLPFQGIFPPKPTHHLHAQLVFSLHIGVIIKGEQLCKLKAVYQLADCGGHGIDLLIHRPGQHGVAGCQSGLPDGLGLHAADPAVENERQRTAFRLGFGGEIPDQLTIGSQPLTSCPLEPPFR